MCTIYWIILGALYTGIILGALYPGIMLGDYILGLY